MKKICINHLNCAVISSTLLKKSGVETIFTQKLLVYLTINYKETASDNEHNILK